MLCGQLMQNPLEKVVPPNLLTKTIWFGIQLSSETGQAMWQG